MLTLVGVLSAGQNARLIVSVCMGLLLGLHPAPRALIAPFLLLRALVLVHACPDGYAAPETLRFFLGVDVVLTALACVLGWLHESSVYASWVRADPRSCPIA